MFFKMEARMAQKKDRVMSLILPSHPAQHRSSPTILVPHLAAYWNYLDSVRHN